MKKIVLLLSLAICGVEQTKAQTVSVGPEIGLNLSNTSTRVNGIKNSNEWLPGVKVGGIVDIGFARSVSFQPGLYFVMKGSKNDYVNIVQINNLSYRESGEARMRMNYIEMPMNLQFKLWAPDGGNFFFGAGPYLAVALGGEVSSEYTRTLVNVNNGDAGVYAESNSRTLEIGDNPALDDIQPLDAGLNFNAGYEFRNGLFLRANMGAGLANVRPNGDSDNYIRNWGLGFSLGYLF